MKIYVDADASPVTDIVIDEAKKFNKIVILVKNYNHFSHKDQLPGVETVYVDDGADAADYEIVKRIRQGDVVVTQDYGLASLCLSKNCIVLHHKGFTYTNANIDSLLETRHFSAKARKAGHKTKGPKAFTNVDREKFRDLLFQTLKAE